MADILIKTLQTDENGKVSFSGLPPGTYKYVQNTTKPGYVTDSKEYTVTVTNTTPISETRTNAPEKTGRITLHNYLAQYDDYPVAGATYKITDANDKPLMSISNPSDKNGNIDFNNLMATTYPRYKVKQVSPPPNYVAKPDEYSFIMNPNVQIIKPIPNTPIVAGKLDISLQDTNYSEYGLQGANYKLYADI